MRLNECLGIAAALICMISCSGKQEQAQSEQIVKTEKAIRHAGGEEKEYAFIARPFRTSELSFRVSGPIDRFEVYVTQEVAKAVRALDSVEVRFDLAPERVYKAPITEVSKGTTRNNLSYLLTILLPNPDRSLLVGMSGKVSLAASQQTSEAGIVIPQYALCHRPEIGDFVWIVNEGSSTVTIREVTKGDLLPDGQVCIRAGLSADETFATSGLRFLSNGMKVKLSPRK